MRDPLVVGFDLDMTLFDTRPGVKLVWQQLSASTGVDVDAELAISRLGPPLAVEMAHWVPPEQVDAFVEIYRSLYAEHAVDASRLLPGAEQALAAVASSNGTATLVTAKNTRHAQLHVDHAGLRVDEVVGDLWGTGKGAALTEQGASIYVGDHVLDVAGARAAGAVSVAVASGPCTAAELTDAGADVVLADLTEFPGWLQAHVLGHRMGRLARRLRELGSVMVAFSGGADSAFLLAAAVRTLGADQVVAATARSDSLPAAELAPAREFAESLGVHHLTPQTHELQQRGYQVNAGDRCYFCKAELVEVLGPLAAAHGLRAVATGTNADDAVAGFRPGIRAATERGAVTPLLDAGLTKAQIRAASRDWGLPTWDKPAAACLSSRIAYGVEITATRLVRVDEAESAVRALLAREAVSVSQVRVRDLGTRARIELDLPTTRALLCDDTLTARVLASVRATGFPDAYVDPDGFRSGSMNELLSDPARYR